jgi:hypothetical protein
MFDWSEWGDLFWFSTRDDPAGPRPKPKLTRQELWAVLVLVALAVVWVLDAAGFLPSF